MTHEIAPHFSQNIQLHLEESNDTEKERVAGFLAKIFDYRGMLNEGRIVEAGRYHETLMSEARRIRDELSDQKVLIAASAAAGAAATSIFFGVGAAVGGLAGGALGYFTAQANKERVERLYVALVAEIGPRPTV